MLRSDPLTSPDSHPARCLRLAQRRINTTTMATAESQQVPTFKLVLVGDGGTGKVCFGSASGWGRPYLNGALRPS